MRSRRIQLLSLPFLLALALLAALLVAMQHHSNGTLVDVAKKGLTYTVVERPLTDTVVDVGTPGDSVGDLLPFANPIFDRSDHRQIGTDEGSCTRTRVGVAYYCDFVITLTKGPHRGRVVVAGTFYDDTARPGPFVVTGGTGAFAHAAGPMKLTTRPNGDLDFRFKLTY